MPEMDASRSAELYAIATGGAPTEAVAGEATRLKAGNSPEAGVPLEAAEVASGAGLSSGAFSVQRQELSIGLK